MMDTFTHGLIRGIALVIVLTVLRGIMWGWGRLGVKNRIVLVLLTMGTVAGLFVVLAQLDQWGVI